MNDFIEGLMSFLWGIFLWMLLIVGWIFLVAAGLFALLWMIYLIVVGVGYWDILLLPATVMILVSIGFGLVYFWDEVVFYVL